MKTRQAKQTTKWERGIPKEKWNHQNFQQLLSLELFLVISTEMKKKKPCWPAETMTDFIKWDNVNNQIDPTEGL